MTSKEEENERSYYGKKLRASAENFPRRAQSSTYSNGHVQLDVRKWKYTGVARRLL